MRLLLCSSGDVASVGIRNALLERGGWTVDGEFQGMPVYHQGEDLLATTSSVHLFADDIDLEVQAACKRDIGCVVFLSRHKAASGIPTLTVHAVGNFSKATYGGRDGTLVPAMPDAMTSALRCLATTARGLAFQVSFEVTHHGPYLSKPTMFIEIGSSEANWGNKDAAMAIAAALMEAKIVNAPKAIGLGGGHYAPRFSEVVATKKVSFGHMIPNHFADGADDEALRNAMAMAMEKSEGARLVYIHKKSMSRARATHIRDLVRGMGAEAIDSSSLDDL
ncbi:MAG: D-aminoacyl-tRNA deacylase [Methanomassiliicoccales archaeon]|jgi:D-aminoacyl-tRNA deacylase|nr:D-aminoacyl-tRNA deacylase [Methanomassiliicoccales archaeon]